MKRKLIDIAYAAQLTLCVLLSFLPLVQVVRGVIGGSHGLYNIGFAVMAFVAYRLMVVPAYNAYMNYKHD